MNTQIDPKPKLRFLPSKIESSFFRVEDLPKDILRDIRLEELLKD